MKSQKISVVIITRSNAKKMRIFILRETVEIG